MSKTETALKLALEALDIVKIHYTQNRHVNEAITAIKEALAQEQEHFALKHSIAELKGAVIGLQAQLAQPEQERPAPCAKHCEATAFQITIKNLEAQVAQRTCLGIRGEALLMAEPYIVEALARHDEAYDRHPSTEAERQIIVDDLEAVRKALQQLELEPVAYTGNGTAGREADVRPTGFFFQMPPQRTWAGAGDLEDSNAYLTPPQTDEFKCPLCYDDIANIKNPPQRTWVGLTDEEKSELWEISRAALPRYATYASLVEAKLKERNT